MDNKKKQAFIQAHKQKYAAGGVVKHYDIGGSVLGMLGLGPGAGGTDIQKPQMANIVNPVQIGQTDTAYSGVQTGLNNQNNLLTKLQTQNGIDNQTQVYNQLQNIAAGKGPNPAQTALANNTAINNANTAALMAGQRGAASNVGLIARQAAQQGANTQQQAVGQAANLQAQQELNAINQAGNLATTQAGQQIQQTQANTAAQQAEQQALINAQLGINNENVSSQGSINSANAGLANNRVGQQPGALSGVGGMLGPASQLLGGGAGGAGGTLASLPGASELGTFAGGFGDTLGAAGSGIAGGIGAEAGGAGAVASGIEGAAPIAAEVALAAKGGEISHDMPHMKIGGNIHQGPHKSHVANFLMAKGGKVPAMVSPGEIYLSPKDVEKVINEGHNPLKLGEKIPGKPKVKGDSLKNDTVPKNLEVGGVVLPRHITNKMSREKAELFVHKAIAKHKAGKQC